ncbi:MAG: toll/interleukin-1 receptor domain-containing protein, partial [Thermogemmatispora sp.]|uniref:toll/interleukin-1 receptor domain-containing protein n=1 Tax=Thermogemmatispora sp. TaxID=1968838 RepID=UPI00261CE335
MKDIGIKDVSSALTHCWASLPLRGCGGPTMGDQGSLSSGSSTSAFAIRPVLCYAQADRTLASQLSTYLSSAIGVSVSDLTKDVRPGQDREDWLRRRIREANVVIVLVGPDFLEHHQLEQQLIQERLPPNDWAFIPIRTSNVSLEDKPLFKGRQLLPRSGKALVQMGRSQLDRELAQICEEIKELTKRWPVRQE